MSNDDDDDDDDDDSVRLLKGGTPVPKHVGA